MLRGSLEQMRDILKQWDGGAVRSQERKSGLKFQYVNDVKKSTLLISFRRMLEPNQMDHGESNEFRRFS